MNAFLNEEKYIYNKQLWEDYQENRAELEDEALLNQLNKVHNRKGYTLSDYQNNYEEY